MENKKYEYLVTFRHLKQVQDGDTMRWNAAACFGINGKPFTRVATSEGEARELVRKVKEAYPLLKTKPNDKVETSRCGLIGIDIEITEQDQIDDQVVDIRVQRREVTEWETISDFE